MVYGGIDEKGGKDFFQLREFHGYSNIAHAVDSFIFSLVSSGSEHTFDNTAKKLGRSRFHIPAMSECDRIFKKISRILKEFLKILKE